MLPNGWLKQSFGHIASFKNGLNFTKSDTGEVIKIVGVGDFKNHSVLSNIETLDSVQVAGSVSEAELLQSGDLLFVRSNGNKDLIGRCLYFPNVKERLAYSGFTIRGRVDNSQLLSEYASYLMRSSLVKKQFSQNGGGTNISNLSQQILNDIVFPLPPLPEQIKIAEILSTWDNAINTVQKLLANSQQQKKSLMQQLLTGKKRFAGFEGEWKWIRVSDLLEVRKERQIPTDDIPLFSLTIENGVTPKSDRYNREFLVKNSDEKKYKVVHPKDIVYNPANLRWGAINFSRVNHAVVVSPIYEVLYIRDKACVSLEFVAQKLMTPDQINRFAAMVEGTLVERMAVKIEPFLATKLSIPPSIEEQKKIATLLTTADQEIDNLRAQLNHLKQEKKALMQQLLTGKRRVKVEEAA